MSSWRAVVEKHLEEVGAETHKNLVYLSSHDMVGISTFLFVSGRLFNRVLEHQWHEIKTGFKNSLGNKGAILLFLQLDSTYFTISNCHLAAGENASS